MKKIMITGLALLTLVPAAAQAQSGPGQRAWRDAQREFRQERREFRNERRDFRNDPDRTRDERREFRQDRREFRDERREHREARREWRDDRRDHRGYNHGYSYVQPRFYYPQPTYRYYAPPPPVYYYPPSYYGGYSSYHAPARWHRGQILPHHYRRYGWNDYHRYGYAPPPYGYSYYRTDTGDIILAAIATGLILSVFAGAW